jgi:NAD(P)-dependent dehydrogenase (short-subunit alcohol dehydrogenase family)
VTTTAGRGEHGDTSTWLVPPLGRIGTAEDVAGAVAFFVSRDSAFCNGSILLVDGGMRAAVRATLVMNRDRPGS